MSTTVKIGADTSQLQSELAKTQAAVGKATAGIGKGIAASIGRSLGPFGELIEKADAFTNAIGAASMGTKVFAVATGAAFAATAFLVSKAVDGWKEMTAAIEDSVRATKQLDSLRSGMSQDTITRGIAAGQEGPAMARNRARVAEIQATIATGRQGPVMGSAFGGGLEDGVTIGRIGDLDPAELAKLNSELATLSKEFEDIASGAATIRGEARRFNENISSEAKKAIENERIRQRAATLSEAEASNLKAQRATMQGLLGQQPNTAAGAITANVLTENVGQIDAILKAFDLMQVKGPQGTTRYADLTGVGGGGVPASVQARDQAAQEMVTQQEKTNQLLERISQKEGTML